MPSRQRPDGLEIMPITPDRLADLDRLLARGDPRSCQCAYVRLTNAVWSAATPAMRRDVHHDAVCTATAEGRAAGLLAYHDGAPVGWVSFDRREAFDRLSSPLLAPADDEPVWSVVCFVVAAAARRHGVASALLDATIDYARDHGVTQLESYPVAADPASRSAASLWRGTVAMFEEAGFTTVAVRRRHPTAPSRPIMRRRLRRR